MNPEENLNRTYGPGPSLDTQVQQSINMLAVPKTWTRLVMALCILLFTVVGLVTFMVYIQYKSTQRNIDRLIDLRRQVEEIKARLPKESPTGENP